MKIRIAVLSLIGLCTLAAAPLRAADGAPALKVAVVRIQDAFEQYDRTKVMKKSIEAAFKPQQDAINKLGEQVQNMKVELRQNKMMEPGSYKWFEKMQEIKTKEYLLKSMDKEMREDWNEQMVQFYKAIYEDFQNGVKAYAEQARLDIVIRAADQDLKNESAVGIQNEIGLKIVHYFRPSLDVTEQVVQVMNRRYKNKAGK